jgi:hypothetical protein
MKKYSPAFVAALTGMSMITHAYAETTTLTPEQIERMYLSEVKVPGKTLRCFQAGGEIVHEPGLQNVKEGKGRIVAVRLDGSAFDVLLSDDVTCTIITRKPAE